jgi:hypothetical protein
MSHCDGRRNAWTSLGWLAKIRKCEAQDLRLGKPAFPRNTPEKSGRPRIDSDVHIGTCITTHQQ